MDSRCQFLCHFTNPIVVYETDLTKDAQFHVIYKSDCIINPIWLKMSVSCVILQILCDLARSDAFKNLSWLKKSVLQDFTRSLNL